ALTPVPFPRKKWGRGSRRKNHRSAAPSYPPNPLSGAERGNQTKGGSGTNVRRNCLVRRNSARAIFLARDSGFCLCKRLCKGPLLGRGCVILSPLPVRERMKVKVRLQRAIFFLTLPTRAHGRAIQEASDTAVSKR